MKLKRVYRPYDQWEEVTFNMWGEVPNRKLSTVQAVEFTGKPALYGTFMRRVTREWPVSCENALTDYFINRRAWLGHAAVALALRIPEDITRAAWKFLNHEQQLLANKEADAAIQAWEHAYIQDKKLYKHMGEPMLFNWDTQRGP
jgi:hypothetical protein